MKRIWKEIRKGGMPAWRANSAAAKAVKGVTSAGFTMIVHPAANVGATCQYPVMSNELM